MADYWVSRKRWTCKYCDITINDDIPSRQQHENGLRHRHNVERALRDMYKKQERGVREKEEAKREMARIERLAREAHQADLKASSSQSPPVDHPAPSMSQATSQSITTAPLKWAPTDKLSAYGSVTADQARLAAEEAALAQAQAEQKATDDDDGTPRVYEAAPGEWQTVVTPVANTATVSSTDDQAGQGERSQMRGFTFKERSGGLDDEDDDPPPDIKVKKRLKVETDAAREVREEEERRRMRPEWVSVSLTSSNVPVKSEQTTVKSEERSSEVKDEDRSAHVKNEVDQAQASDIGLATNQPAVKKEASPEHAAVESKSSASVKASSSPPPAASTSLFKKRKAGAGAGAKKVRMF